MTVTDILQSVRFVVDREGKPTAAIVDMSAWEAFLQALEEIEDRQLVGERLAGWQSKEGWTSWEDFEREIAGDGVSDLDKG